MKCARCGLENLEHVNYCVKCGLQLRSVSLPDGFSAEPPRGHGIRQSLRRVYWSWRRSRQVNLVDGAWPRKRRSLLEMLDMDSSEPLWRSLAGMAASFILPGAGQFYLGRHRRGTVFIIGAFLGLFFYFMMLRTLNSGGMRGAATLYLILQNCAVFDAMPRVRLDHQGGIFRMVFLVLLIWAAGYAGINYSSDLMLRHHLGGRELLTLQYPFPRGCCLMRGDTVLLSRQPAYERGNIVMYNYETVMLRNRVALGLGNFQGIDRVIGLPGERVELRGGRLRVNGEELKTRGELMLLNVRIPDIALTLGKDEYFIFPSLINPALHEAAAGRRTALVVPLEQIRGRVMRIVSPITRMADL